eukprot:5944211-Amphidinium_carterae.1
MEGTAVRALRSAPNRTAGARLAHMGCTLLGLLRNDWACHTLPGEIARVSLDSHRWLNLLSAALFSSLLLVLILAPHSIVRSPL